MEHGDSVVLVSDVISPAPATLQELLEQGHKAVTELSAAVTRAIADKRSFVATDGVEFGPAIIGSPTIIAVGLNYAEHAAELGYDVPEHPTIFGLLPGSVGAHEGTTTWAREVTDAVDYEVELGVVIGRDAFNVTPAEAVDFIFGYTVVNDLSARDVQQQEQQWFRCKSFDGFTPVGPVVVTADSIPDPQSLALMLTVNGQVLQASTTANMMRTAAELVSYLSRGSTLKAGTLIATGTPSGAGFTRTPQVLLQDGDIVEATIEGIGTLVTHCRVVDAF